MGTSRRTRSRKGGDESSFPEVNLHHLRVEAALRIELAAVLRDELGDPRLEGVRLVALELSLDGSSARIAVATPKPEREVQDGLAQALGFIRSCLADRLDLKRLPGLRFCVVGPVLEGGEE